MTSGRGSSLVKDGNKVIWRSYTPAKELKRLKERQATHARLADVPTADFETLVVAHPLRGWASGVDSSNLPLKGGGSRPSSQHVLRTCSPND